MYISFLSTSGIDFLSFRFWIGLWVTAMLLVCVVFDLSSLVRFITRFTEESFAVLISLIFVVEAFRKVAGIWNTHPVHLHAGEQAVDFKCHCVGPGNESTPMTTTTTTAKSITEAVVELFVSTGDGDNSTQGSEYSMAATTTASTTPASTTPSVFSDLHNWTGVVYENCITYQGRVVVDNECITEQTCTDHGWSLVGPACNVNTVTHSVPDVFFLCWFLFIGTFGLAYFFRRFKGGLFFPSLVGFVIDC